MTEHRGANLIAALEAALPRDGDERAERIARMASEAGITESTVTQILRGEIDIPPERRLRGFARALGIAAAGLIAAAERDGANYTRRYYV